jgi:hypothetical protein
MREGDGEREEGRGGEGRGGEGATKQSPGSMDQVIECLPSKCEAQYQKKKKKKKDGEVQPFFSSWGLLFKA